MVSSRVLTKPPACLRSQLHDLIFCDLRRSHRHTQEKIPQSWCQTLSTVARNDSDQPAGYKRIQPNGRVIGKPGRRQQVISEQLKTNSLNKTSNIVVLRDVKERDPIVVARGNHRPELGVPSRPDGAITSTGAHSVTAEEIEGYVTSRHRSPEEEEVNTSIDALRPASRILDGAEFERLAGKLSERYTLSQLKNYVARSVELLTDGLLPAERLGSRDQDERQRLLRWRPGRTPIERRLSQAVGKRGANSKTRVVDQLLRLVWNTTVLSEEQAIGELEMKLEPWQIAMLFDVQHNGRPSYKHVIQSKYLLDTSNIQVYRPGNILRITARRQDAEEIAKHIDLALRQVQYFDFDLRAFDKMLRRRALPEKRIQLFCAEDLSTVSNATQSLIYGISDHKLRVYSFTESMQHTAKRLLVALLDVPGPRSFQSTRNEALSLIKRPSGVLKRDIVYAPIYFVGGPPQARYRELDLVRATQGNLPMPSMQRETLDSLPTTESSAGVDERAVFSLNDIKRLSLGITNQLNRIRPLSDEFRNGSISRSDWSADLCYVLRDRSNFANGQTLSSDPLQIPPTRDAASLICTQLLGIEKLASYLEAVPDENGDDSELVVNMVASPFTSNCSPELAKLPRVEVSFRKSADAGDWICRQVKGIVDEQSLATPLPSLAVDVHFKRQLIWTHKCTADSKCGEQLKQLQDAINKSCNEESKIIMVKSEILLELPASLVNPRQCDTKTHQTNKETVVQIPYALGKIETMHSRTFKLRRDMEKFKDSSEVVRDVFKRFPENLSLRFCEVDGDVVARGHTKLSMVAYQASSGPQTDTAQAGVGGELAETGLKSSHQTAVEDQTDESTSPVSSYLTKAAVRVANLLTQANAGHLSLLSPQKGRGNE